MPTLHLTTGQFHDLFFNHEHPEYDALMRRSVTSKDSLTYGQVMEAALKDAESFVELYARGESAKELAEDFVARI